MDPVLWGVTPCRLLNPSAPTSPTPAWPAAWRRPGFGMGRATKRQTGSGEPLTRRAGALACKPGPGGEALENAQPPAAGAAPLALAWELAILADLKPDSTGRLAITQLGFSPSSTEGVRGVVPNRVPPGAWWPSRAGDLGQKPQL